MTALAGAMAGLGFHGGSAGHHRLALDDLDAGVIGDRLPDGIANGSKTADSRSEA
jgi:hypothetical protein